MAHGLLSSCGVQVFSSLAVARSSRARGLCSCGAWVSEHVDSVVSGPRALVEARELSSCGTPA